LSIKTEVDLKPINENSATSAQRSPYTAKVDSSRPSFVCVESSVHLKDITQLELYNLKESNKPMRDLKLGAAELTARKKHKSKKSKR
jgi:hypothetical protein